MCKPIVPLTSMFCMLAHSTSLGMKELKEYQSALEKNINNKDWQQVSYIKQDMDDMFESGDCWYKPASKISDDYNSRAFSLGNVGIISGLISAFFLRSKNYPKGTAILSKMSQNPSRTFFNGLSATCLSTSFYSFWKGAHESEIIYETFHEHKKLYYDTIRPVMPEIMNYKNRVRYKH